MTADVWRGEWGNEYTQRNAQTPGRGFMWNRILRRVTPASILEVGANKGLNLDAISQIFPTRLIGLEPNDFARSQIAFESIGGTAQDIPLPDNSVEMVFTCGVLIHIPPDELDCVCDEMYRVSSRYIVSIEYFSDKPESIPYMGRDDLLWKRDFGQLWLDRELQLLDYGFFWKPVTGLDNLTWWLFEKR